MRDCAKPALHPAQLRQRLREPRPFPQRSTLAPSIGLATTARRRSRFRRLPRPQERRFEDRDGFVQSVPPHGRPHKARGRPGMRSRPARPSIAAARRAKLPRHRAVRQKPPDASSPVERRASSLVTRPLGQHQEACRARKDFVRVRRHGLRRTPTESAQ
jgi:hypothetical protein